MFPKSKKVDSSIGTKADFSTEPSSDTPVYSRYIGTILGETSAFKNQLLNLSRIKNGPLDAKSKREVLILILRYFQKVNGLTSLITYDPALNELLKDLEIHGQELSECLSKNDGGYEKMENLFAQIVSIVGYIQGYLYCLSNLGSMKSKGQDLNQLF